MRRSTLYRLSPLCVALALSACAGRSADRAHADAMAQEHARDAPSANVSLTPRQDVVERTVEYGTAGGRVLRGHLARPLGAGEGPLPALIVIHEWWGLNENIQAMTNRLAGEGYVALAVDMYDGQVAEEPARARELMSATAGRPEVGMENLRAAARYLLEREGASRVGLVGWCFGGGWSLRGALGMPEMVDAVVVYYGQPITGAEELARLDAPLLGLFAAEDQGIPLAQVRAMERTLRELGKQASIVVYPGVGHAFANPSGGSYDETAAANAWERTVAFFGRHLKGGAS